MKVDHLTHMGISSLRDSLLITLKTLDLLKQYQVKEYGAAVLDFPSTNFSIKITTSEEGAIFDLRKSGVTAFVNFCCFEPYNRDAVLERVKALAKTLPVKNWPVQLPRTDRFLYTVPVFPHFLKFYELQTAGEVEFNIYYSIYLGRIKQ